MGVTQSPANSREEFNASAIKAVQESLAVICIAIAKDGSFALHRFDGGVHPAMLVGVYDLVGGLVKQAAAAQLGFVPVVQNEVREAR